MSQELSDKSGRARLGRWRPFPDERPEDGVDCRCLVVIYSGDFNYIGIRAYNHNHNNGHFHRNSEDMNEMVYWWTSLLLDGERSPPVPNAAEQVQDAENFNYQKDGERMLR